MEEDIEFVPKGSVRAYGKSCIGCKRHKKDVMLSFIADGKLLEVFLDDSQAEWLEKEIGERRRQNQEPEIED